MRSAHRYRIHDFLEVESDYELGRFSSFEADSIQEPNIVVQQYRYGTPNGERVGDYVLEPDGSLILDLGPRIRARLRRVDDRFEFSYTPQYFRVGDPEELIQAIMTQVLELQDVYVLNAAGLRDPDGHGILLFGPPQSGKTTTSVQLAQRNGWELLSDEIVFLERGTMYCFPRPIRFRHDSPLYGRTSGGIKQVLAKQYRQAVSDGTRRLVKHLKHRIPGVNAGGTVVEAGELVNISTCAGLSACVFLHPSTNKYELTGLSSYTAAEMVVRLSSWLSDHPFLNRFAAFDIDWQYTIPAVDEGSLQELLEDCALYVARASRHECTSLLENKLNVNAHL